MLNCINNLVDTDMLNKLQAFVTDLNDEEVEDVKALLEEFVSPQAAAAVDTLKSGSVLKGLLAIGKIARSADEDAEEVPNFPSVIIQCPHCREHFSKELNNG